MILTIADNGIYTEENPLKLGFGTNGMMERCKLLSGECTFTGISPQGLTVTAIVPIDPPITKK
ncbi:hypothetical protein NDK43_08525 [Neobacillus pocheonensis]|uniref:Sensor histidine kinase n=1 Tax=Neobacillus pocheonensis TaxID=363869 RepID=A0ABT0W7Y8_9BACI|nr:hypothetical protein [Neobacillus pocheonensis]